MNLTDLTDPDPALLLAVAQATVSPTYWSILDRHERARRLADAGLVVAAVAAYLEHTPRHCAEPGCERLALVRDTTPRCATHSRRCAP